MVAATTKDTTVTKQSPKDRQKAKVLAKRSAKAASVKTAQLNKEKLRQKAKKQIESLLKKGKRPSTRKVWHTVRFQRPVVKHLPKAPKYSRKSAPAVPALDKYAVLKYPVTTDERNSKIESENTITFIVDRKATKKQVKKAFKEMYATKVESVRTLITMTGEKKAFIKLNKDVEAVEVATKIGIC